MSNVIKTDRFQRKRESVAEQQKAQEAAEKFQRLSNLQAEQIERINANPWPTLEMMSIGISKLSETLKAIERAVHPAPQHVEEGSPIQPTDMGADAIRMVSEVRRQIKLLRITESLAGNRV